MESITPTPRVTPLDSSSFDGFMEQQHGAAK